MTPAHSRGLEIFLGRLKARGGWLQIAACSGNWPKFVQGACRADLPEAEVAWRIVNSWPFAA